MGTRSNSADARDSSWCLITLSSGLKLHSWASAYPKTLVEVSSRYQYSEVCTRRHVVSCVLDHRAGNKLHARTVTQKLRLEEGSLQLAMGIGEWLVMPSEVYELSRKFIALLKASSEAAFCSAGLHALAFNTPSLPLAAGCA